MKTIVIGAGIAGLAAARTLKKQGYEVHIFDRHDQSRGASVQNFGMFCPIGLHPSVKTLAERSGRIWQEILTAEKVYHRNCGLLIVATRAEELAVLKEFHDNAEKLGYYCEILSKQQTLERSPIVNPDNLLGALFSPSEFNIDPRTAMPALAVAVKKLGCVIHWNSEVKAIKENRITLADGTSFTADRIVVAAGYEFQKFYPDLHAELKMQHCKLQMMRTAALSEDMGPMLAGGFSLLHYPVFKDCPSLPQLQKTLESKHPKTLQYGIHALLSQHAKGELCMGDSHQYGYSDTDSSTEINEIILNELQRMVSITLKPVETWNGYYGRSFSNNSSTFKVGNSIDIFFPNGGIGMTLSFGLAEEYFS